LIDEVKGHLNHKNEHMQQQQQTHERSDDFETKRKDIENLRKKKINHNHYPNIKVTRS
jgi:hypothetical protein